LLIFVIAFLDNLFLNLDGFVKSPSAALRCIHRRCSVPLSTLHSSGFARLASGAFYFTILILTFYESINLDKFVKSQVSLMQPL
ncbi:MAG: hypothetical protein Q7J70_05860, partial [Thermodesulfovibrionales bacterium]|nr:hypothetical protein [Thermodesulfovibrionales bacterium]